jgi:hypothetical protein
MELFGRLTDTSAALGEAKLYSAKGWALWQKVCAEKLVLQQELDAVREKNAQRDRQDRLDGIQAGVHHDNIKASVARMENEKAAKEVELQEARNAGATAARELRHANTVAEDRQKVLEKRAEEVQALEVVSIRLMNQIEQLEEQGGTLLEERNAAMTETVALQDALAISETELNTARAWNEAWNEAETEGEDTPTPKLRQNSTATAVNLGPDINVRQWQPAEHEKKHYGASRMFPEAPPVTGDNGSSSSPSVTPTSTPTASSSSSAAPPPSPASDTVLHNRAVLLNPLEYGGSGVEREQEIQKTFKMLKANREKEFNAAVGGSLPAWRRQLERDTTLSSVATPSEWPPQEWGEDRRAASARLGPDREPEPPLQSAPVQVLVSGLDSLQVKGKRTPAKRGAKKGTPKKGKAGKKRSPSPASRRVATPVPKTITEDALEIVMDTADDEGKGEAL